MGALPKVSASSAFDKLRRVPKDPGVNVTLIGALSQTGLDALMTIPGATTGDVFLAYVEQVLGPTLRPGDVVVMDNLRAHKVSGVAEAIASRGAEDYVLATLFARSGADRGVLVEAQDGAA